MSDLTAANCGCNDVRDNDCCSSIIWIILLLSCCGNGCGNGFMGGGDNNCLWIILLLCCCGNGFGGCGF